MDIPLFINIFPWVPTFPRLEIIKKRKPDDGKVDYYSITKITLGPTEIKGKDKRIMGQG